MGRLKATGQVLVVIGSAMAAAGLSMLAGIRSVEVAEKVRKEEQEQKPESTSSARGFWESVFMQNSPPATQ